MKTLAPTSLPCGFTIDNRTETIACKHRDLSCCGSCADEHCEIVEVVGVHYWIADDGERRETLDMLSASRSS